MKRVLLRNRLDEKPSCEQECDKIALLQTWSLSWERSVCFHGVGRNKNKLEVKKNTTSLKKWRFCAKAQLHVLSCAILGQSCVFRATFVEIEVVLFKKNTTS